MHILSINPFECVRITNSIALVYQQSFGGDPWNEGYTCPLCSSTYPLASQIDVCPCCINQGKQIQVVEYWPLARIISDFYKEMSKPDALCTIAQSADETIGFAWGYRVTLDTELDNKLDAPDLHRRISGDFFYLDECALAPDYQSKGIGKLLVKHILSKQRQEQMLLRTKRESRMYAMIAHMGGRAVQEISNNRVMMVLPA